MKHDEYKFYYDNLTSDLMEYHRELYNILYVEYLELNETGKVSDETKEAVMDKTIQIALAQRSLQVNMEARIKEMNLSDEEIQRLHDMFYCLG